MKGFSSKTLATRLKQLEGNGILERKAYNEIPPRVEYRHTVKGQELVESVVGLFAMDAKVVLGLFQKQIKQYTHYTCEINWPQ